MVDIVSVHHIGIRVSALDRSVDFYRHLGFELCWEHAEDSVYGLRNAHGVEINLIVNANESNDGKNVLMDVTPKYAGYTHVALQIASIEETLKYLKEHGISISEGPVRLGDGVSLFVRDPDRNVIELRHSEESL
jgi:lactoylglutathione lyase